MTFHLPRSLDTQDDEAALKLLGDYYGPTFGIGKFYTVPDPDGPLGPSDGVGHHHFVTPSLPEDPGVHPSPYRAQQRRL
jgi:hypothetical protein